MEEIEENLKPGGIFHAEKSRQQAGNREHHEADDLAGDPGCAGADRKRTL